MRLFLMRHATTEDGKNKEDVARLLTEEGKEEAAKAREFIDDYHLDKVLVSYVKRAVQTANIIIDNPNDPEDKIVSNIEIVTDLYRESEEKVIELIKNQEDKDKNILIVGHNPIIYNVITRLSSKNTAKYDELIQNQMVPAKIVILDFTIDSWLDIAEDSGEIKEIFIP
ncbi:MAG: histidine phosphatase family protein [Rickettsiaceae bacterium]|nr:histidine phosphatase family protein [Rickettsiaceae bacterium]